MQKNYGKALLKIKKLEEKYGDMAHVPEGNAELQEIRALVSPATTSKKLKPRKFKIPCETVEKVVNMAIYGYNSTQIMQICHVDGYYATQIVTRNNIKRRKQFNYCMTKPNHPDIYFSNILMVNAFFKTRISNSLHLQEVATRRGYHLKRKTYLWGDIPDNSWYMTDFRGVQGIYVKDGINSYEQKQLPAEIQRREESEWS